MSRVKDHERFDKLYMNAWKQTELQSWKMPNSSPCRFCPFYRAESFTHNLILQIMASAPKAEMPLYQHGKRPRFSSTRRRSGASSKRRGSSGTCWWSVVIISPLVLVAFCVGTFLGLEMSRVKPVNTRESSQGTVRVSREINWRRKEDHECSRMFVGARGKCGCSYYVQE